MAKRKDVERAFGVLQGKFRIVGSPCKYWKQSDLNLIMKCCLILHNMIIEHERRDTDWGRVVPVRFMSTLKNLEMHLQLRTDLVKHIAARPGRGGQEAYFSSLEGTNMEYVVLPSSDGDYDETDLEEEVVPGQNEDGAFDYYGDYNDQIPGNFEHATEHVYGDKHVEDEYEHDGEDDEDDCDDEDEDDDDDVEDDDEEAAYDGEDLYDDDDVESYDA
ncbi:acidic leucine-rich nuclear phosphoprotein 32 family member B-like [Papaver somniferum]|uniref:acidic leucine-rich nuclear phosphoprotein 32 family member B-like n=1 Tax=Papaver somniferum TaxID=3469 RepID=UPI000E6FABCC|nr:acidic leucine-rich nuclear phosphoprotein 32 family member B-like [Papaver somniferum]